MNSKKCLVYLYVFLITNVLFSQSVSFGWAKQFESNRVYGSNVSIVIDSKKNVYSVGLFTGTADFDPGPGIFNLTTSNSDLFVAKLDSLGNFVWARQIAGNNETVPFSIDVDSQDNIYFTGHFVGTTDFDPNASVFNLTAASHDIFICKLDSSGNFVFAKSFHGTINYCCDYPRSIAIDKHKNIYTCGSFNGTVDFDPNVGNYSLTSNSADIFISKLDSLGNFVWAKQMGGLDVDQAFSLTLDRSDNILTTGSFKGVSDFDPGNSTYTIASVSSQDIYVSKLDPNGKFVWAKRFGGGGGFFDVGNSIAVDTSGSIFTTGLFFGTADFDPGVGIYNITSPGMSDVFISKLDSNGNFEWAKHMGSGGNIVGKSICTDQSGNVYTTGYYSNGVDFDPGTGIFYLYCSNLTSNTFISKLNSNGDFVFAKSFWNNNSGSQPYGTEIKIDSQENVYIGGYYKGIPDFDPNSGIYNLSSLNFDNSYVVKLNQCTLPNPPIITIPSTNLILCSGNSATLTAISEGIVNWYDSPSATMSSYSGDSVITFAINDPFYTFYAQAYTCDAGPMTTVTFTINVTPTVTVNSGSICYSDSFTMTPNGANTYVFSSGTAVVSPTTNTTYTITGTNINGCENNALSYVYLIPSPTITVNNGIICSGKTFTINPSGTDYYTYSSGSAIVSPTSNTTYTVTGTSSQGCQSSNMALSSVSVNPSPTVTAVSSNSLLCTGNSATLIASGAQNYIWSNGYNLPYIIVSPLINTSYTVIGTNSFGCSNTYSLTQNVSDCLRVLELTINEQRAVIYPNPINDKFYIELLTCFDTANLELYNIVGELLLKEILYNPHTIINSSGLYNGVYFAKIIIDNKTTFIQKIIKQ